MPYKRTVGAASSDGGTPADGSITDAKVAPGAAINADKIADGTTNHVFTAADDTKLGGVATGATANSADATLLARANHTGTQTADTLTDGTTNKAFLATERTKLTGIATSATANATDAQLRDRATHTGTQTADTVTDGSTNKAYTGTEQTKLAGIATSATANDTDANLKARANHTGTQTASTVSDFSTAADARITAATGVSVQPIDSDLTTLAGLTATTDNFVQAKANAWASRTVAQVKTDLGLTGTNSGDQTSIVGVTGTKAQFDTAVTDGNILYVGDVTVPAYRLMTGRWYFGTGSASNSGYTTTNNRVEVSPLYVPNACTFDLIMCRVDIAGLAACVVRLGIWSSDANGDPATLVLDAGTVVGDATGNKLLTISQAVSAGLYWLSATVQGATSSPPQLYGLNGLSPYVGRTDSGDGNITANTGYSMGTASGALPGTPPAALAHLNRVPTVMVRVA